MAEYAFLADGYTKSFRRRPVLKSAAVWARSGSITVLLGRNASGKTTLLKCAMGVYRGIGGTTRLGDKVFDRPKLWQLAREGLFYWPDHDLLSRRRTLSWHLGLVDHVFGREVPDEPSTASGPTAGLSGGERTMAELAIVRARKPRVLIADEPLAGLAPQTQVDVAQAIRDLADGGAAIVLTGHDAHFLLDVADDVVWMSGGSTVKLGDPESARRHHQFRREYLGFDDLY